MPALHAYGDVHFSIREPLNRPLGAVNGNKRAEVIVALAHVGTPFDDNANRRLPEIVTW
jgi:hypothetical protein